MPRVPVDRVERFRAWLEALTAALEAGDGDALGRCFAVECSWQPGPFAAVLRGRTAIGHHLGTRWVAQPDLDTTAEVLGVGATYGVARWTLSWGARGAVARADGILLVALDARGRASAVREWTIDEAG